MKQKLFNIFLILICILNGYGFYKMNNNDWISGICFGLGLLGIFMSYSRNKNKEQS